MIDDATLVAWEQMVKDGQNVRGELLDAIAEIRRLRKWVNDLQAGMFINCVYCGHRYGPDTEVPASKALILKEHIEVCPDHPMSALKRDLAAHRAVVRELARALEIAMGDEFVHHGQATRKIVRAALAHPLVVAAREEKE